MSHVQKKQRPGSDGKVITKWRARWITPEGDERCKTFDRKIDADAYLVSIDASMQQGAYVDPRAGQVSLEEYLTEWLAGQVWRDSTDRQVRCHMRNHVTPHLGHLAIGSLNRRIIQQWIADRSQHLAPSTLKVVHGYLSAVLRTAVEDRLTVRNPCDGSRLPKAPKVLVTPPTTAEVQAIIDALPPQFRTIGILLAGTGLRCSEATGLTEDRINFTSGRSLRIDRQLVCPSGVEPHLGSPKTESSVRDVPTADVILEALARHLRTYPVDNHLGLVFTTERGEPIRRGRMASLWAQARGAAVVRDDITPHSFRHYYASLQIHQGASVKAVQDALGHASARETLETYAHLWPADEQKLRDAVQMTLGPALAGNAESEQAA